MGIPVPLRVREMTTAVSHRAEHRDGSEGASRATRVLPYQALTCVAQPQQVF